MLGFLQMRAPGGVGACVFLREGMAVGNGGGRGNANCEMPNAKWVGVGGVGCAEWLRSECIARAGISY